MPTIYLESVNFVPLEALNKMVKLRLQSSEYPMNGTPIEQRKKKKHRRQRSLVFLLIQGRHRDRKTFKRPCFPSCFHSVLERPPPAVE